MQAAGDRDGDYIVVVRGEDGRELANALGVGACGSSDIESAVDTEYIAPFERTGRSDIRELAKFFKGSSERSGFGAARFGAQRKDHSEFIENDGGIFDEHGIGKRRFRGERDDCDAEVLQELLIGTMLFAGFLEVDGEAVEEGEFAIDHGGADGAGDSGEHGR